MSGDQQSLFTEPSWPELWAYYEATYLPRQRPRTVQSRKSIGRMACAYFASIEVMHPRAADWSRYLLGRVERAELTRTSANAHRKVCSHAYAWCRDLERDGDRLGWRLLVNPLRSVPVFACPEDRPRAWADPIATYQRLLDAAPDPMAKAFFSALRRHGLRLGEGLGLMPQDADEARGLLRIERQRDSQSAKAAPLKTSTSAAALPLHPETAELLREARRWRMAHPRGASGREFGGEASVFLFPFYLRTVDNLMAICRRVAPADFPRRKVGVDGGDAWHTFRHTFTIGLVELGVPESEIHDWLRHRDPSTTTTYLRALKGRVVRNPERVRAFWAEEAQREQRVREQSRGVHLLKPKAKKP